MDVSKKKYQNFPSGAIKPNLFQVSHQTNSNDLSACFSQVSMDPLKNKSECNLVRGDNTFIALKVQDTQIITDPPQNIEKHQIVNFDYKRKQPIKGKRASCKLAFEIEDSGSQQQPQEIPYIENGLVEPKNEDPVINKSIQATNTFKEMPEMQTEIGFTKNQLKPQDYYEEFIVRRDQKGLNKLWNRLDLFYKHSNKYFCSAKMTGYNKEITFLISENKNKFVENDTDYLGKVKTNFKGNEVNIYGPGYNAENFKIGKMPIRELLATVQYQTEIFGQAKPREFKVFALKSGVNYYQDLQGPIRGKKQIPLNKLYQIPQNKQKILVMQNMKPQWSQQLQTNILDFGGRAKRISVKNYILRDLQRPHTIRSIFGKIQDDQFRLDVNGVLSPLVGLGIALSGFGGKFGTV